MTSDKKRPATLEQAVKGKAAGGLARAAKLTPEQRTASAKKAAAAKAELAVSPRATHGSSDRPLKIGDVEIPCYVLEDGTRVLSQRGLLKGLGMAKGSVQGGGDQLTALADSKAIKPFETNDLSVVLKSPIKFKPPHGGRLAYGYPATVLADICEAVLASRTAGELPPRLQSLAVQCEVLVRGFARVGIIALVDEATGYQKDRAKDALAKILEAFVAKELQPYVKTFPAEYYEELFRLYKLPYPPEGNKSWRPSFIGNVTNEVVYSRLAPDLLPELKRTASKAERKAKLHQWLTAELGHPKLREHLASLVAILKLSDSPADFKEKVNRIHPRFGETVPMDFTSDDE